MTSFLMQNLVNSKHPIAKAIFDYAEWLRDDVNKPVWPEAKDFVSVQGQGVKATVKRRVVIGNRNWNKISVPVCAENTVGDRKQWFRLES